MTVVTIQIQIKIQLYSPIVESAQFDSDRFDSIRSIHSLDWICYIGFIVLDFFDWISSIGFSNSILFIYSLLFNSYRFRYCYTTITALL